MGFDTIHSIHFNLDTKKRVLSILSSHKATLTYIRIHNITSHSPSSCSDWTAQVTPLSMTAAVARTGTRRPAWCLRSPSPTWGWRPRLVTAPGLYSRWDSHDIPWHVMCYMWCQVSPLGEEGSLFTLRLATSHHSFSLGRSVATRSAEAFYQLQVTRNTSPPQLTWLLDWCVV